MKRYLTPDEYYKYILYYSVFKRDRLFSISHIYSFKHIMFSESEIEDMMNEVNGLPVEISYDENVGYLVKVSDEKKELIYNSLLPLLPKQKWNEDSVKKFICEYYKILHNLYPDIIDTNVNFGEIVHTTHHYHLNLQHKLRMYGQITHEILNWMKDKMQGKKVIDLGGGIGWYTLFLSKMGIDISNIDLNVISNDYCYNPYYQISDIYVGNILDVIEEESFDLALYSWPPVRELSGDVIDKLYKQRKPFIYVGEDYCGCTACDKFFDILYDKFDLEYNLSYNSFYGLHDQMILATPKC